MMRGMLRNSSIASRTVSASTSAMLFPWNRTSSVSRLKRRPSQLGHGA
jgi:hypothetical protein